MVLLYQLDAVLKVVKGSGMGLPHSGAVSESAFLEGSEKALIPRLEEFSILYYARFKDDVICIYDNIQAFHEFVHLLAQGHPFELKIESENQVSVEYLEVVVSKTECKYKAVPACKTTALSVPWLSKD
mgnify:CR=1 FL=1